jgi:hypothetical protein
MVTTEKKKRTDPLMVRLTETKLPEYHDADKNPKTNRRWRRNYPSGEVTHHWSRNSVPFGYGGNVYFEDGVIYSYGRHFPMARHVRVRKGGAVIVLLNSENWRSSSTTPRHKADVRHALYHELDRIHEVPDILADTRARHLYNLNHFKDKAFRLVREAENARSRKGFLLQDAAQAIREGNRYAAAVGLTERLGSPVGGDLTAFEEWARREVIASQAKRYARWEARRERNALRDAEDRKRWEEVELPEFDRKLAAWRAGESDVVPEHPWRWFSNDGQSKLLGGGNCIVRVSRGKFLQTSKGMTVPLDQVMPLLDAVRSCPEEARLMLMAADADPAEATIRGAARDKLAEVGMDPALVGKMFSVEVRGSKWDGRINWDEKTVSIGCHTVSFEEIMRAAAAAGL